jgi:hypothetical protein
MDGAAPIRGQPLNLAHQAAPEGAVANEEPGDDHERQHQRRYGASPEEPSH